MMSAPAAYPSPSGARTESSAAASQCSAGGRWHHPPRYAYFTNTVKTPQPHDPPGDEHAQPVPGGVGDMQGAPDPQQEEEQQERPPDEPQFFPDDRKDEVGVLFGDEAQQVLGAGKQPLPPHLPRAHGDLGLVQRIARAQRVDPRVQEDQQPPALVIVQERPEEGRAHQRQPAQAREQVEPPPRQEEHPQEDRPQDQGGAQVLGAILL